MNNERVEHMLSGINEEYEENIFRLAIRTITAEIEGRSLDEELRSSAEQLLEEAAVSMPDKNAVSRFLRRMNRRLKSAGKRRSGSPHRIMCMASAAILAIIIAFSVAFMTVDAFRVNVLNLLISIEPEYTTIQLTERREGNGENNNGLVVNWSQAYVPSYIPEGFEVSDSIVTQSIKRMVFTDEQNETRFITYTIFGSSSTVAVDTENAQVNETIKIGGRDGMLVIKNSVVTLALEMNGHLILIQGMISRDEIINIAESIVYRE
ncbi:MAG: DUF4367 domain-containing protein [Clostridiales bacterium]|nr:DUF4367 domain-containing protein [Clostridiales bacterium]